MKNKLYIYLLTVAGSQLLGAQGFNATAIQWNIPQSTDYYEFQIASGYHTVMDMNGDGLIDLVDTENQLSSVDDVFFNGSQKYWKVYLNTGSGFSATATQWNIPAETDAEDYMLANGFHSVIDFNGDGKPDFIDSENAASSADDTFLNGTQKYWKVYLNNGSGFDPTPVQWNIPANNYDDYLIATGMHSVIDFNGDGKPDFIDSENALSSVDDVYFNGSQRYWKVYLNNGTGFDAAAVQWNLPAEANNDDYMISTSEHAVIDFDGDGKPDFVDSENGLSTASDVYFNGSQKYWKVYLNNGSGFNAASVQWNIPAENNGDDYLIATGRHSVIDFDGDRRPDFIDSENAASSVDDVFFNGSQKYWKVYLSTGSGFSATATQWNIPAQTDSQDYMLANDFHSVIDFNGDGKPDFIDSENAASSVDDTFLNGTQKYWKVYLNNAALGTTGFANGSVIAIYPNPVRDVLNIDSKAPVVVSIYNTVGQQVLAVAPDADNKVDVSGLSAGAYIVKISSAEQTQTTKIIKQ